MALLSHIPRFGGVGSRRNRQGSALWRSAKRALKTPLKHAEWYDAQSLNFANLTTETILVFSKKWLANKTPQNVASWIASPDSHLFVATESDVMLAVGGITSSGEITLNYMSPKARFRGISKAVLARLEGKASELGNHKCSLTSTETAHQFYLSAGYRQEGSAAVSFIGTPSYPMTKQLFPTRR